MIWQTVAGVLAEVFLNVQCTQEEVGKKALLVDHRLRLYSRARVRWLQ